MQKTIRTLRLKSEYYSKRVEQLATNDIQNNEIRQLIDEITSSDDGQKQINEIYSEADNVRCICNCVVSSNWFLIMYKSRVIRVCKSRMIIGNGI